MKKNGFTLVELLAVIVILGLLGAIIAPRVVNLISDSEDTLYNEQVNKIINATKKYVVENSDLLPDDNNTSYIDVDTLLDEGVIDNDNIINPKTKEVINGYVSIRYSDLYNQYVYEFYDSSTIIGSEYVFDYTGDAQEFCAHVSGYYKLEVWGAQGGYRSDVTKGGAGGYASGIVNLDKRQNLYVYVGGSGNSGNCSNNICIGGYNGGGNRYSYKGGGGATDIRLVFNTNPLNKDSLLSRIIVAGGGGSDGASSKAGGAGGGLSGIAASDGYGSYGYGGTQTNFTTTLTPLDQIANTNTTTSYPGGFGFGGFGIYVNSGYGGAGGGGWYGGAGNLPDNSGDDDKGGGGGSGFTWSIDSSGIVFENYSVGEKFYLVNSSLIAGNASMPTHDGNSTMTGNLGNGYAKITYLGKSIE